jgi:hypothetical protein
MTEGKKKRRTIKEVKITLPPEPVRRTKPKEKKKD